MTHLYSSNDIIVPSSEITVYELTYPGAANEDKECLMYDNDSGDLYIVQKNQVEPSANIYKFTPPVDYDGSTITMTLVGKWNKHLNTRN